MDIQLVTTKKTEHVTLPIYNLSCGGGGSLTVEKVLTHTLGVVEVYVNPVTEMAYINYDPELCNPTSLTEVIDYAGFGPRGRSRTHVQSRP